MITTWEPLSLASLLNKHNKLNNKYIFYVEMTMDKIYQIMILTEIMRI